MGKINLYEIIILVQMSFLCKSLEITYHSSDGVCRNNALGRVYYVGYILFLTHVTTRRTGSIFSIFWPKTQGPKINITTIPIIGNE